MGQLPAIAFAGLTALKSTAVCLGHAVSQGVLRICIACGEISETGTALGGRK